MRSLRLAVLSIGVLLLGAMAASVRADYAFSGSGTSGNLASGSEPWTVNYDGGALMNDWGSPGIGAGIVPYTQADPAYGFVITFTPPAGAVSTIDVPSVATGNGAGCVGSTYGGTTFCTISPTDIWEAFVTGPDTIEFLAQSAAYDITTGQDYFVNIFFDGTAPASFTGEWLTEFTPTPSTGTPEPSSFLLLGIGLLGLVALTTKRKLLPQN